MGKGLSYKSTFTACCLSSATQAVAINLSPLLFLTFSRSFGISLAQVTFLITINFIVQLLVDIAATKFVDKIGYRATSVAAQLLCGVGLVCLSVLPRLMSDAYAGLIIATLVLAVGAGCIEVTMSPIVQALPSGSKSATMSLLHSFYCWGHVAVVLLSTLYFAIAGQAAWKWLPIIWAALPILTGILFSRVPLRPLVEDKAAQTPIKKLFGSKLFLLFMLMMVCSGAAEQSISQWASLFAEAGLSVSKTLGDLLGPCLFAALMGTARLLYGIFGAKLNLEKSILGSAVLCIGGYCLTIFSPVPVLSLVGCGICGFSVAIMWPGTMSLAGRRFPAGGTAMFALFALGGDVGCSAGPTLVGLVSDAVTKDVPSALQSLFSGQSAEEIALKTGLFCAIVFPLALAASSLLVRRSRNKSILPPADTV